MRMCWVALVLVGLQLCLLTLSPGVTAQDDGGCPEGLVWRKCRTVCPITCDDPRPMQRDECDQLECDQEEGFCVCPDERPVMDEVTGNCISFAMCDNAADHVVENDESCDEVVCNAKETPWRCPQGSTLGHPVDSNGCNQCRTCLDTQQRKVNVPLCWRIHTTCHSTNCGVDQVARLVNRAGKGGEPPCCHTFECVPAPDI